MWVESAEERIVFRGCYDVVESQAKSMEGREGRPRTASRSEVNLSENALATRAALDERLSSSRLSLSEQNRPNVRRKTLDEISTARSLAAGKKPDN